LTKQEHVELAAVIRKRRNHWEKTSRALLVSAILHVLYAAQDKTPRGVANFLCDPSCTSRCIG
jgi:type IV secretory pathway TraG/TraD family ATPase VirD4